MTPVSNWQLTNVNQEPHHVTYAFLSIKGAKFCTPGPVCSNTILYFKYCSLAGKLSSVIRLESEFVNTAWLTSPCFSSSDVVHAEVRASYGAIATVLNSGVRS